MHLTLLTAPFNLLYPNNYYNTAVSSFICSILKIKTCLRAPDFKLKEESLRQREKALEEKEKDLESKCTNKNFTIANKSLYKSFSHL